MQNIKENCNETRDKMGLKTLISLLDAAHTRIQISHLYTIL